ERYAHDDHWWLLVEAEPEQGHVRRRSALEPTRDGGKGGEQMLPQKHQRKAGDAQIQPAEPAGHRAERESGEGGEGDGEHHRHGRRKSEAGRTSGGIGRTGEVAV